MKLVVRHLNIQRRVYLIGKTDLESMLDESSFCADTEIEGFLL